MSTEQRNLTDFQTAETNTATESDTTPDTTVILVADDADTNHQCNNCGRSVSPRYHEFHRDTDGILRRCQNCKTQTAMKKGAGAVDDYRRRQAGDDGQEPVDSLFGRADTSDLPDYMTGGGD